TFLVEPSRRNINDELWDQPWDIIFFAGHSRTEGETGRIYINPDYSLTISELWYALRKAVDRGLQLAIFNSCDGLGLARELDDDLYIPQMIVMRELIPDQIAQEFLKYFLTAFSDGQPFHLAVQIARQRLHGLEDKFPCATWLPVIYQNPTAVPPVWKPPSTNNLLRRLGSVLLTSVMVTGLIMGVRHSGKLKHLEFPVYDQMMRLRGDEGKDHRLMLVTIDDADIKYQQEQGWNLKFSLSDEGLAALLKKLDKYEPSVIGLYVPRDIGIDQNQKDLKTRFETDHRLYAVCFAPVPELKKAGIPSPPGIPQERQGFTNIVRDSDGVVRRHLLSMGATLGSTCTVSYAFSTMLAFRYLHDQNHKVDFKQGDWIFGDIVLEGLQGGDVGYTEKETEASQILLNYRTNNGSPLEIAETITLRKILQTKEEQISSNLKNRIIIIGVTTASDKNAGDRYPNPYSTGSENYQEIPGIMLHAQMTSQLLSAVLDNRALLKVIPQYWEFIWVLGWSLIGGVFVLRFHSKLRLILILLAGGTTICISYCISYGFLLVGYSISFVPLVLATMTTGSIVLVYFKVILSKE
ncbi:MAG: CHASE2 domain-containing protein, partial [Cyanobacteriota bacterium]|nr:CHASE2 domain-containing protein [Cyanobacteriota bacterium]